MYPTRQMLPIIKRQLHEKYPIGLLKTTWNDILNNKINSSTLVYLCIIANVIITQSTNHYDKIKGINGYG